MRKRVFTPESRKITKVLIDANIPIREKLLSLIEEDKKLCLRCNKLKPLLCFWRKETKSTKLAAECRDCVYLRSIFRKFGIKPDEYKAMLEAQSNCCALCQKQGTGRHYRLVIDHDHATGKIRGILCHRCNIAIGIFKDSPALLQSAINYLTPKALQPLVDGV